MQTATPRCPLRIFVVELVDLDHAAKPILVTGDQDEAKAVVEAYNNCRMLADPGPVAVCRKGLAFYQRPSIESEVVA
ncbi:MAG: hypothetical protein AB7U73_05075 [Pirellulales bacterium]